MWWAEIASLKVTVAASMPKDHDLIAHDSTVELGAHLDESDGPISIGARTRICRGAIIKGPVVIGSDCLIGCSTFVRGPTRIGNRVKIGFSAEVKQADIRDDVSIGPMCFVADSRLDQHAYLGAMVRTSNQRLDRNTVQVRQDGQNVETGMSKLGCWIGARASLGIQTIILPGRVIAPDSLFEPRLTINRNYPTGHYRAVESVELVTKGN